jgi:predicted acetyltransferase
VVSDPFRFVDIDPLSDEDLRLVLTRRLEPQSNPWRVPTYYFDQRIGSDQYVGRIRLSVGWNDDVVRYAGQIGYAVEPDHRGRRYAERACRLILPLARRHGMDELWITCQPDNAASRRTLERLGARSAGVFEVPDSYPLDAGAQRKNMCFRLSTAI